MNTHWDRAKTMYGGSAKSAPAAMRPASTSRAAAGAVLYGSGNSGQTGSIDNAIRSTFDPIEASSRDDVERLKQVQTSREKVRGLLQRGNVAPSDAHTILSVYGERRAHQRSEEAIAKHWQGPDGFDRVRREAGSTEAAMKQLASTEVVLKVLQREDPAFAQDLVRTGASQDPRFIQTAAKIVDSLKPKEQTT